MKPLEPPDRFHVEAAKGWLELGNAAEAKRELEQISAPSYSHPEVLRTSWRIRAQVHDWIACVGIARLLKAVDPIHSSAWVREARSLEQLGRISAARQVIVSAIDRFGPNPTLSLEMAHLSAAQPRTATEAQNWISTAIDLAPTPETLDSVRIQVLKDPILKPLWTFVQDRARF